MPFLMPLMSPLAPCRPLCNPHCSFVAKLQYLILKILIFFGGIHPNTPAICPSNPCVVPKKDHFFGIEKLCA